jgi:hypothetical protein
MIFRKKPPVQNWIVPTNVVTEGTILICDNDFTCIPKGNVTRMVKKDKTGFFISCNHGRHYLDGQLDTSGKNYVGFRKKT